MLSPEQVRQYRQEGSVVFDPGLPATLLDRAVAEVRYDEPFRPALRRRNAWKSCPGVRGIAVHEPILAALRDIYAREPYPFQTLNFPVGTQQKPHSDLLHFDSIPQGLLAAAWVALEDIDQDNGPVLYYPGSHRLPVYTMEHVGVAGRRSSAGAYEAFIEQVIEREGLAPRPALLPRGHVLLWDGNVLHGGAPLRDPSRTRHSQVTHYYFEGCRYFTPLRSRGDRLFVRNPRRIRARPDTPAETMAWLGGFLSPWYLRHFFGHNLPEMLRYLLSREA